jgi:hypothetical protein
MAEWTTLEPISTITATRKHRPQTLWKGHYNTSFVTMSVFVVVVVLSVVVQMLDFSIPDSRQPRSLPRPPGIGTVYLIIRITVDGITAEQLCFSRCFNLLSLSPLCTACFAPHTSLCTAHHFAPLALHRLHFPPLCTATLPHLQRMTVTTFGEFTHASIIQQRHCF